MAFLVIYEKDGVFGVVELVRGPKYNFKKHVPDGGTFLGYVVKDDNTCMPGRYSDPTLVGICQKLGFLGVYKVDTEARISELLTQLAAAEARAAAAEAQLAEAAEANQLWQKKAKEEGWTGIPVIEVEVEVAVGANAGHQDVAAGGALLPPAPVATVTHPTPAEVAVLQRLPKLRL